jgi:hypothetical protein
MSTTRKVLALSTAAAVAGGALMVGAGAAGAASDPDFKKVKAPKSVTAGETFVLKCQLKKSVNWTGADASLLEKGAAINAHRAVSASGDCSMHVVLNAVGKQKIRVVVEQNMGAIESKWVTINVTPAS